VKNELRFIMPAQSIFQKGWLYFLIPLHHHSVKYILEELNMVLISATKEIDTIEYLDLFLEKH